MTRATSHDQLADLAAEVRTELAEAPRPLRLLSIDDLRELPPPSWLVDQLLPDYGVSVLFGASGSMKSFLAADWALSIAAGVPWLGHRTEPGPVVYAALEGGHGLLKRIEAWTAEHEGDPREEFRAVVDLLNLLDGGNVHELVDIIRQRIDVPPRLIVIDTVARAMPGGDENSTKDMGLVIAASDLLARTFSCAVLLVHHTGHGESGRERGASALPAAAEARLRLSRSGQQLTLTTLKQKDFVEADPIQLTYREVGESLVLALGEQGSWRPTEAMAEITRLLGQADEPLSQRQVEDAVAFQSKTVREALRQLADDRVIDRVSGPRGSLLHSLRDEPDRRPLQLLNGDGP